MPRSAANTYAKTYDRTTTRMKKRNAKAGRGELTAGQLQRADTRSANRTARRMGGPDLRKGNRKARKPSVKKTLSAKAGGPAKTAPSANRWRSGGPKRKVSEASIGQAAAGVQRRAPSAARKQPSGGNAFSKLGSLSPTPTRPDFGRQGGFPGKGPSQLAGGVMQQMNPAVQQYMKMRPPSPSPLAGGFGMGGK
jgi:hypothetical protein